MYFTLFPPISLEGSAVEKSLDIPGLEALKSIQISAEKVSCTLDIDGDIQTYDVISFNDPFPDVNFRVEPDDNFPLELMPLITIEFLESFAKAVPQFFDSNIVSEERFTRMIVMPNGTVTSLSANKQMSEEMLNFPQNLSSINQSMRIEEIIG